MLEDTQHHHFLCRVPDLGLIEMVCLLKGADYCCFEQKNGMNVPAHLYSLLAFKIGADEIGKLRECHAVRSFFWTQLLLLLLPVPLTGVVF